MILVSDKASAYDRPISLYESMEVTRTGVEDDGDFVARSDASDKMGGGDSASNRGLLVSILDTFATEVCSTSLTHL